MYEEKLLPHDIEAEEAVVGSLLMDGDSILKVLPILKQGDFYREKNRVCAVEAARTSSMTARCSIG